jgi:hypothetical protein
MRRWCRSWPSRRCKEAQPLLETSLKENKERHKKDLRTCTFCTACHCVTDVRGRKRRRGRGSDEMEDEETVCPVHSIRLFNRRHK